MEKQLQLAEKLLNELQGYYRYFDILAILDSKDGKLFTIGYCLKTSSKRDMESLLNNWFVGYCNVISKWNKKIDVYKDEERIIIYFK